MAPRDLGEVVCVMNTKKPEDGNLTKMPLRIQKLVSTRKKVEILWQ
jgi:hypothetical protein